MTNTRNTKRTFLTSVLSLVLCVAMLVGTTFAWFTDTVTSAKNVIKSGNLDVEMYWAEGDEDPATVTSWKDASKGAIFNSSLWEPGYTEAKHIKVSNVGTLALRYQMRILANGVVSELVDVIDVYYLEKAEKLTRATVATKGTKLGTLSEVLNNTNDNAISKKMQGSLEAGKSNTVTIALKMQESAGNEYQNLSIGTDFSIQLLATQYTSENDSFDNTYDAKAEFAAQEKPSAMVSKLTGDELKIYDVTSEKNYELITGYQFEPTETYNQVLSSEYRWWQADFIVSADQDIPKDSLILAGFYQAYADYISNQTNGEIKNAWVGIPASEDVAAGTEIGLMQLIGFNVAYKEICQLGNDGTGFRCGIVALNKDALAGKTIKVELRLYEVENADIDTGVSHQAKVEPEKYISIGTVTYTFPAVEVADQTEMNKAFENGAVAVEVGAGNYTVPSAAIAGKEVTIIGTGDDTVFDFTKVNSANSASITFENVKFQGTNANVMDGFGIQNTSGHIAYKNCTFDGAVTNEYFGTVSYENCTFTGTGYITTYAVKSASFENCVFDKADSRAILVYSHGDNPVAVTISGCEFKAAEKEYTYAGDWTAAIEVDTTNIKTAGTTVTIENCTHDSNYSGLVRDKSAAGATPAVIKVDGVTK